MVGPIGAIGVDLQTGFVKEGRRIIVETSDDGRSDALQKQ
jgi:hypothetical protein